MFRNLCLLCSLVIAPTFFAHAADDGPTTEKQKLSYAVGHQVGESLKRQQIELDADTVVQAIHDVLTDRDPRMSAAEMRAAIDGERNRRIQAREAVAEENSRAGSVFLADNRQKEGVKVTESGLQYKVITSGTGAQPGPNDSVVVNYRGTLLNGEEFDSSYRRDRPATLPLGGVIKGWQEGLQLMHEGDKWQLFVPAELAYGARGAGNKIGPNQTLIFEVELLEVKPSKTDK